MTYRTTHGPVYHVPEMATHYLHGHYWRHDGGPLWSRWTGQSWVTDEPVETPARIWRDG
ncbi:MAG: hypothetical protein ABR616_15470 [Dermatophilaceae bacterium]